MTSSTWLAAAQGLHRARGRASALAARALSGYGLPALFVAIYALVYAVPFPLLKWHDIPQIAFSNITGHRLLPAAGLVLASAALVALCWRMWRLATVLPARSTAPLLVTGWLGAAVCALLTFPGHSTDMGDYTFRAHMLVHLGQNPLTTPPSELIALSDFPYLAWYRYPDSYGPLWQWLSGGAHALAGEDMLANLLVYKVLAIAAIGLSGYLIYAILSRVAPTYRMAGLALWLWNPVVLSEGAVHGHNDFVAMAIVLAGLLLLSRGRGVAGLVVLAASGLVKAYLWIFLPVAALWLLRQHGWRRGAVEITLGALLGSALVWLTYWPFGGWGHITEVAGRQGSWAASTWTAAIFYALRDGKGWTQAMTVRWVLGGATALFAVIAAVIMLRIHDLFLAAWAVVLAYLLVGCYWFMPWYAIALIAMAALVPDRHVAGYTLVFSMFMLLIPVVWQYGVSQMTLPPGASHAVMAATTMLVPQALAVYLVASHSLGAAGAFVSRFLRVLGRQGRRSRASREQKRREALRKED